MTLSVFMRMSLGGDGGAGKAGAWIRLRIGTPPLYCPRMARSILPGPRAFLAHAPWMVLAVVVAGCGGSPPTELAGFQLGMSQEAAMTEVRERGGFTCRLTASRPRLTTCEGPTPDGDVRLVVRDDALIWIRLRMDPAGPRPERAVRRLVGRPGDPAWRERPYFMPPDSAPAYHTLWVDRDTTRTLSLLCADRRLAPPCYAELTRTSPPAVEAKLDSLMGIRSAPL
jgi:hypothetical protein